MTLQKVALKRNQRPFVAMTGAGVRRKCASGNGAAADGECAACRQKREAVLQRVVVNATPVNDAPVIHDGSRSAARPLDADTRAFMEPRFGHDFGHVRIHTDAEAAASAKAVNARAYTIGDHVTFAAGAYQPARETGRRLLAHELVHVVQQQHVPAVGKEPSVRVGAPDDPAEREADRAADLLVGQDCPRALSAPRYNFLAPSVPTLQRDPAETQVRVDATGYTTINQLPQGKGGSGAVVYEYSAHAKNAPADKDITKPGSPFNISLPLLVYPPAVLDPPKVDLFVFFHGMRADYGEGGSQGSEPIAIWTHLKEAVAGTNRLGIAPQAPKTWRLWDTKVDDPDNKGKKKTERVWDPATAQWDEALANVGFDGLIKIALDRLSRDLKLSPPLVPGEIHVAGHSAGGIGITEATNRDAGAKTYGDLVQDVTLQDAGYSARLDHVMDWFLEGSPGKTVRVLLSQDQGGPPKSAGATRSVLTQWFNVEKINKIIDTKKKSDTLKAEPVTVPDPKDQKPRPGGFVLESQLVVKNKKTGGTQGTMVAFFAPGGGSTDPSGKFHPGGHYETATASMGAAAGAGPKTTGDFLGEAKPGTYRVISKSAAVFEDADLSKPMKRTSAGTGGTSEIVFLPRDTIVEVVVLQIEKPEKETARYVARIKTNGVEGWTSLTSLAQATAPMKN
jgi:uncharacterized protein DUF4157